MFVKTHIIAKIYKNVSFIYIYLLSMLQYDDYLFELPELELSNLHLLMYNNYNNYMVILYKIIN